MISTFPPDDLVGACLKAVKKLFFVEFHNPAGVRAIHPDLQEELDCSVKKPIREFIIRGNNLLGVKLDIVFIGHLHGDFSDSPVKCLLGQNLTSFRSTNNFPEIDHGLLLSFY